MYVCPWARAFLIVGCCAATVPVMLRCPSRDDQNTLGPPAPSCALKPVPPSESAMTLRQRAPLDLEMNRVGWENMCPCCVHEPDPAGDGPDSTMMTSQGQRFAQARWPKAHRTTAKTRRGGGGGGKRTKAAAERHKAVQNVMSMTERLCLATALYEPDGESFLRLRKGDLLWASRSGRNGYIEAFNVLTEEAGLVLLFAVSEPLFVRASWTRPGNRAD